MYPIADLGRWVALRHPSASKIATLVETVDSALMSHRTAGATASRDQVAGPPDAGLDVDLCIARITAIADLGRRVVLEHHPASKIAGMGVAVAPKAGQSCITMHYAE